MKTKYKIIIFITIIVFLVGFIIVRNQLLGKQSGNLEDITKDITLNGDETTTYIESTYEITQIKEGLSTVRYDDEYGFNEFIEMGGASSDSDVVSFLTEQVISGGIGLEFGDYIFGCSTISAKNSEGDALFGRNFDWNKSEALIIESHTEGYYSSISTVNLDFINAGIDISTLPPKVRSIAALYAPLDGMNEKGFTISVNMIQDSETINQNTEKPDITTTTAIRLLLNRASNVDEAIAILNQYDMHASMDLMIHFSMADINGRSVVVEYVNNQMKVIDTPVVTNFYLDPGNKFGVGTTESHTRYEVLMDKIEDLPLMESRDVREALSSVSKKNFGEFESTEWSIVFNQNTKEIEYYHRENYQNSYNFRLD